MFWEYLQAACFHLLIWIYTQTIQKERQNNLILLFHSIPYPSLACSCTVWLTYKLQYGLQCFWPTETRVQENEHRMPSSDFLPRHLPQGGGTFNRESCVLPWVAFWAELRPSSVFCILFSLGVETTVWLPALSPTVSSYPTDIFTFH